MADQLQTLEDRLAAATTPQEKVTALNNLASYWVDKNPQRGRELAQSAIALAQADPHSDGYFNALLTLSRTNQRIGDFPQALQNALEGFTIADTLASLPKKAEALERLGAIYDYLGNYSDSLRYNLQALKLVQGWQDRVAEARILNTIGILYNRTGNYQQELTTYQRALQLAQTNKDRRTEAVLHNNIAMAYCALQEYDLALENARRCLVLARQVEVRLLEVIVLCTLADIYQGMGDDASAQTYLEEGLAAAHRQQFDHMILYAHLSLGRVLTRSGKYQSALSHLQTALPMAEQQQARQEWAQCHEALYLLYKAQGHYEQALIHHEQFHTLQETLFTEQSRETLRNLQVLHQTEYARRDAELYRLKSEELEAEITRRQAAEETLRYRTLELEAQNAELDAFAHTVAHDLKSPLAILLGLTGDADALLPLLSEDQIEQIWQMISHSARKMTNIVDELLLLSTVRGQAITLQPIVMTDVVAEALSRVNHHLNQYQGKIEMSCHWPPCLGYAPWIEEVWVNYLSNAIKYGGTPPLLILGYELLPDSQACFWVRDNGEGLSPEQIERLFIPFERLHQVHTKGHGLGLSIVRRIVEKLGGRVGAELNQETQGSTFYFTLPLATPS